VNDSRTARKINEELYIQDVAQRNEFARKITAVELGRHYFPESKRRVFSESLQGGPEGIARMRVKWGAR
jgi:hypothetical protein